jgi:hypothetical protein
MRIFKRIVAWTVPFLILPLVVLAAEQDAGIMTGKIDNPIAAKDFTELLALVLKVIVSIGLPIIVIAIIWVGFKYVLAQGNDKKISEAHAAFKWVMIGAAIVLGSQAIVSIIQNTVNKVKAP